MLFLSCRPASLLTRQLHRALHDQRWPGWQVIIGIETHAQIKSRQKLFSDSLTSSLGEAPNIHVSPFDAAFPGTLPQLNQDCVDLALRTAIALKSDIQTRSSFDRKHYFYSDLPSGYQITQHYAPVALGGQLYISNRDSPIRITQIQLEQDTAKSTFDSRTRTSNIDLNRAGTGLLEIVTEPDIRSPEEAGAYVRALQAMLRAIGASDGNMEAGSLRCDVNVSINPVGKAPGTRCEIKNLNSIKFMQTAIIYEVNRQRDILSQNGVVSQETRGFNQDTLETFTMRSKEQAPDYRYMPDPNLGFLFIAPERINHIAQTMPELPWATRIRLVQEYGLSEQDADILLNLENAQEDAVAYFDHLCKEGRKPRVVFNWMVHELLGRLHAARLTFADNPLTTSQLGELIDLVHSGAITGTSGKMLLREMLADPSSSQTPTDRARSLSLLISSGGEPDIGELCAAAIAALPSEAQAFRKGHKNVLNKLLGWVMKESRGRANSTQVKERLISLLEES
ncbi:Glutamyl-tRNA(Gln) amidotransferase subunit B, mitochondrial [Mycena sanguinolenta]|uniref:Glutamyl-tRNA(Gln) amidotransferase subunit B, mitochondrial n=1 Tax=Mycena sanguinolenta TaxID=230812 RepID=A0A8H7CS09_9AGAR|nr:Glutamyl-tRNA(Gln) amidotransferase subunit B, mitochondrial [Mycena sanguinolenta]